MINFLYKKKKANTLIELLLYISLFVVIFSSLFVSLSIFYSNKVKNRTILEVEQQGQLISMIISQEIRNAQSIVSPLIGGSANSLSLEHLDPLKNPLVFSLSGDKIVVSEGGVLSDLSSSKIRLSNLNFDNNSVLNGTQSIAFSFDISYISDSKRQEYKYNKSFFGTANLLKK